MPHPFLSPPLCSSPQGLLQVRPAWSQTEPQGKDRVASEVMCRVQGPGSRSDAHSFSVSGWSVFGLCLKHKHNSSLILVSYRSQVLNYPINKIHLVFDLWKIFLYGWKEVCGQSDSINFHWSDSEPSAQALLQGEGCGLATRRAAWGVQRGLHGFLGRGLCHWCLRQAGEGVLTLLCLLRGFLRYPWTHGVLCPGEDSLDPSAFISLIGGLLGGLLWPESLW